jgi:hypothetical protein
MFDPQGFLNDKWKMENDEVAVCIIRGEECLNNHQSGKIDKKLRCFGEGAQNSNRSFTVAMLSHEDQESSHYRLRKRSEFVNQKGQPEGSNENPKAESI